MKFDLFITRVALTELMDAFDFYEANSPGLGKGFLKSLEGTYQKMVHLPKSYGFISKAKDIRDVRIKDFPFVVIFQIFEAKIILRVFNIKRKPSKKF